ncbi:hypothetical protein ABK046_45870, partial [Streptomyces caeruleatus]
MKLSFDNPDKLFFCSDLHLSHTNILKYGRGKMFKDVEEMNEAIIKNWNDVVPKDCVVICAGD